MKKAVRAQVSRPVPAFSNDTITICREPAYTNKAEKKDQIHE